MSEHDDLGARLARALQEEAEAVRPEPALHPILARTRRPSRSRRWWPALAGAVAAGGLVAAALVVLTPGRTREPPVATQTEPTKTPPSGGATATVYFTNGEGRLVPEQVAVPDTADPMSAVEALLSASPSDPDYGNSWQVLDDPTNECLKAPLSVRSVSRQGGLTTVDFDGPVDDPWTCDVGWAFDPVAFSQQLVWTVHDALDSAGLGGAERVVVTMDGEPVDTVLSAEVDNPIQPDPAALAPVQIESPTQGETVSSPVTVSGQSATFEGNVAWQVQEGNAIVDHGFTTSQGANGVFGAFEFTVELPPGDYTIEAYEESAEDGEAINLDSKDVTVEPGGAEATTSAPTTSEMTVYMLGSEPGSDYNAGRLFPQRTTAPDTGEPGLDAVNALLNTEPVDPDHMNVWSYLQGGGDDGSLALKEEAIRVTSVTERDGVITVDFSGPVDSPWEGEIDWVVDPRFFSQQLVWTVQDALDSNAPVLVTMDGEPVDSVVTADVKNPIKRDPYALAPVRIESPTQGDTVSSPVTVSGQSATFEWVWRVKQDGEVVERGFTTSKGANGVIVTGPLQFTVQLPPGDYTVEAYEQSAENGEVVNLDSKDFTVE